MPERPADLEPLPSDVLGALDAERKRPGLSPAHQAALAGKIAAAIAVIPGGSGSGSGSTSSTQSTGSTASTPAATSGAAGTTVATTVAAKGTAAMVALFTAGAVVGGAGGAALHARYAEPKVETRTVYVQVPAVAAPEPKPEPKPEPAPAAPTPVVVSPQPKVRSDVDLAVERDLLESARLSLGKGNALEALETVHKHQARFPRGRLSEERESIAVQALLSAGRKDEARVRAEAFKKSFPESLLLPLVESLLEKAR